MPRSSCLELGLPAGSLGRACAPCACCVRVRACACVHECDSLQGGLMAFEAPLVRTREAQTPCTIHCAREVQFTVHN